MLVFTYFFEKMDLFRDAMNKKERKEKVAIYSMAKSRIRDVTRSLILAVSVCYHARLSNREEYEKEVVKQFTAPLTLPGGVVQFRNEIRW